MAESVPKRMTVEEFIPWAMARREGEHYELVGGEIVALAPERAGHARSTFRILRRLAEAIEKSGLPCEVFPKWMAVKVDAETLYQPDVLVRCGDRLPDDALVVTDPLILVEVRSPSTGYIDAGLKLGDYFRVPTVRHYLIVDFKRRAIIHHERDASGSIGTRIVREGAVRLDPPGIDLGGIFEEQP